MCSCLIQQFMYELAVADPGFPVGGAQTCWGGANLRRVHFLVKTYVKTKEMDPVGGARTGSAPLDPPMARSPATNIFYEH